MSGVKVKVVGWTDVTGPRIWRPQLSCGHRYGDSDDVFEDEAKAEIEEAGEIDCDECTELEKEIERTRSRLRELEERRR